jgi:hypothetical protein
MSDDINSPRHYTQGGYESIDMIEDQGHGEGFCYGSILKYVHRARFKGDEAKDLQKAKWYIDRRIKQLDTRVTQVVVPGIGNRIAGDTDEGMAAKHKYYEWDGKEVTHYCDWCNCAIYSGDTYVEAAGPVRFCAQGCHDNYMDYNEAGPSQHPSED